LIDDFLKDHTVGLEDYLGFLRKARWDDIVEATGLTLEQIHSTGERLLASHATIVCWAMGLTQHKHSVPTLRDVVNVLLLQGNIGKPGAGVCRVRGRSNVQGDRTMGIFEKMPEEFHDMLDQQFGFLSPRKHGYDTVAAIRAMRDGKVRVFIGMGGTFVVPHPPRDARRFETPSGKAHLTGNELEFIKVPPGAAGPADAALTRPVQHHHPRQGRPIRRHPRWPPGGHGQRGGHRRARIQRRRHGSPGIRVPAGWAGRPRISVCDRREPGQARARGYARAGSPGGCGDIWRAS